MKNKKRVKHISGKKIIKERKKKGIKKNKIIKKRKIEKKISEKPARKITQMKGKIEKVSSGIKNLDEKNVENLRRIDISAQQLSMLVGDILDVTRLEQGRMKFGNI
jgi:K+-sensing histidine kinase KdpD